MRRRQWKEFHLDENDALQIESVVAHDRSEPGTRFHFENGIGTMLTNATVKHLRSVFRLAYVPMPDDWIRMSEEQATVFIESD